MTQPVPAGIDPILWNLAELITAIQALQIQPTAITPQQIAALQTAITASPALGMANAVATAVP